MFKVGDTIVCINIGGNNYITVGKEYTVVGVRDDYLWVYNDANYTCDYRVKLFKKVSESVEEQREELVKAVKVITKYLSNVCAEDSLEFYSFSEYNEEDLERAVNMIIPDEPVKTPAQIEAEEIAEQMKKLEERLKELSKNL